MKKLKRTIILLFVFAASVILLSATALADGLFVLDGFPGLDNSELYYRSELEGKNLWLFDKIVDAAMKGEKTVDLENAEYSFTLSEARAVFNAVQKEYIGDYVYTGAYYFINDSDNKNDCTCSKIELSYNLGYQGDYSLRMKEAAEAILNDAGITKDNVYTLSAKEKAFRIHDALVDHIDYVEASDDELGARRDQVAYSGIVDGKTVCAGYGRAFQLLMVQCGVENIYVSGTSKNSNGGAENHGWNLVKEDEGWYHIDVTWDDGRTYDFFNLSSESISTDHELEAFTFGYPATPQNDGWNPAKDPAYDRVVYQSVSDDWYIYGVYSRTKGKYYTADKKGFSVTYGDSIQIIIKYGPGCNKSEDMKVYLNGKQYDFTDKGTYFYVFADSCRGDIEVKIDGIEKSEKIISGSVAISEENGVLSKNIISLPDGVSRYYYSWVVDGNRANLFTSQNITLSNLEYGQTVQLYVWVEGYYGYLKSDVYVVSLMNIDLANDCKIVMNSDNGIYNFHFSVEPANWIPVWVGVYDNDGRFVDVIMLNEAADFEIESDVYELRFFSIGTNSNAFCPISDSISVLLSA